MSAISEPQIPLAARPYSARCSVQEAACMLAEEPVADPIDPFAVSSEGGFSHGSSRWLCANYAAMTALVGSARKLPPMPDGWDELMRELRFSSARSLWGDLQQWRVRAQSMQRLCRDTGVAPADCVKAWALHETGAHAFLAELQRRNARLVEAGERLLGAASAGQMPVFGRWAGSHAYDEIPQAVLMDPRTHWARDRALLIYEDRIRFAGGLTVFGADVLDVRIHRKDIEGLKCAPKQVRRAKTPTLLNAAMDALRRRYPDAKPAGGKMLENLIIDDVVKQGGLRISPRTVRQATKRLRDSGSW